MEAILTLEASQWGAADVLQFLERCNTCEETTFKGVSLGTEFRYSGPALIGTALVHGDGLVHAALHKQTPIPPFPRSYWVRPGRLLAGYYPGDVSKDIAKDKIERLLDSGIRCVVNLVEEDEKGAGGKALRSYAKLLADEARSRHLDVSYFRIPIRDVEMFPRSQQWS